MRHGSPSRTTQDVAINQKASNIETIEPTIESTDVFITSWLTGGCAPAASFKGSPPYNSASPFDSSMSFSSRNSFPMDASGSKSETSKSPSLRLLAFHNGTDVTNSYGTQTPQIIGDANDTLTAFPQKAEGLFQFNQYKEDHRTGALSTKRSHPNMIATQQGQFSFTGSPILEHDFMEQSLDDAMKDEDSFTGCTTKVRRIGLEDRPRPHFFPIHEASLMNHNPFMDDHKRQLFSRLDCPSEVKKSLITRMNSDMAAEISPKEIFAFPTRDLFAMEDDTQDHTSFCPSPPVDHVTPIMTKKELEQSPAPPLKRFNFPSSPNTPSIHRRGKARSPAYDEDDHGDERNSSSPYHHSHSAVIDEHSSRLSESRFNQDFQIIGSLGNGSFGTVYKCLSRLDGCTYAVKAAKKIARGATDLDRMLKEVHALAALSDLTDPAAFHIVRYHQAWLEDRRLFIQTELCTSTLSEELKMSGLITHDTQRRYKLLREMSLALDLIHRKELVHLDIKPENIFIKNDQYKLGDFGLVNKSSIRGEVDEEGDSRYMAKDLLGGIQLDLTKVHFLFSIVFYVDSRCFSSLFYHLYSCFAIPV